MEFPSKTEGNQKQEKNNEATNLLALEEMNLKAIDLISEEKPEEALSYLKKGESILESLVIDSAIKIDKKLLFIILHNMACCYQKLKDFDNCVIYLEAVIFHFDNLVEAKFDMKMNEEYFSKVVNDNLLNEYKLGDLILQIRFSAKFHLQMCAVLSQNNNHTEALRHAKIASLMCEDNIVKTQVLFKQIQNEYNSKKNKKQTNIKTNHIVESEDYTLYEDKIKDAESIFTTLVRKIKQNKTIEDEKMSEREKNFDNLRTTVRKVLSVKGNDDWTCMLNIGNIMYLSALTVEDLDLESDPKFELLRDAIIEKVIMLTVSYFCVATEIRFIVEGNITIKNDSETWHYKSLDLSRLFLPGTCPIVKHYISSYNKHYGSVLTTILEDEVYDHKIEAIRFDFYNEEDLTTLYRSVKVNSKGKTDENKETRESSKHSSTKENGLKFVISDEISKIKESDNKAGSMNQNDKLGKTRNVVSPTKFQTTQYTIVKKSLTPFMFTSTNNGDLTLSKTKLEKENQTKKLYLSNNTNNSNGKLKIKNINSLKYINTTNFLKFKVKDKETKLPLLKITSKDTKVNSFLSPPKIMPNKKVKIKAVTSGNRENVYLNTISTETNTRTMVSPKIIDTKIINQIFKKDLTIKRTNTPNTFTKISIKR